MTAAITYLERSFRARLIYLPLYHWRTLWLTRENLQRSRQSSGKRTVSREAQKIGQVRRGTWHLPMSRMPLTT